MAANQEPTPKPERRMFAPTLPPERSAMDTDTFEAFRELVYAKSGIALRPGKEALVCARVGKRMRLLGIQDYRDYLAIVKRDESGEEIVHLLDCISTNVTSFYREAEHFDFLADAIGRWHAAGQKRFRIWSAAASSGEEPYTLAITLQETLPMREVDVRILATDISTRMLQRCQEAIYKEEKVKSVPEALRRKYFERTREGNETQYRVRPVLKNTLLFRRLNLSTPPFPMKGPMDVIFCRNVMIYFDNDVRKALLNEMYRLLKPGGYLMVGHAESLTGMMSEFRSVKPSIYVR
jgi:chemotaxis protein methyltransferase CheR